MKRKYKDLWKNKWGWTGLIIGLTLGFFSPTLLGMDCSVPIACGFFGIQNAGILAVLGFIAGLILQKIWRKLR